MHGTVPALAALALLAWLSAGCAGAGAMTGAAGSGGSSTPARALLTPARPSETVSGSSASPTTSIHEQAVKFAECMRKNGVSKFPDPDATGALTIETVANGTSIDTDSAQFKQAITACKDLEPAGFTGHKRSAEQQAAALKFAQCIRDNGVKDFPDPGPDDPMIDTNRIPSANRPGGMNILHAAMQKCRGIAADAGVTGGQ